LPDRPLAAGHTACPSPGTGVALGLLIFIWSVPVLENSSSVEFAYESLLVAFLLVLIGPVS
jgi:hypothetical protein